MADMLHDQRHAAYILTREDGSTHCIACDVQAQYQEKLMRAIIDGPDARKEGSANG